MAELKLFLVVLLTCFASAKSKQGEDYLSRYNHENYNSPKSQASYQNSPYQDQSYSPKPSYKEQSYSHKPSYSGQNYNPINYQTDGHTQSYAHQPESNRKEQSYSLKNYSNKDKTYTNKPSYNDLSYNPKSYKDDYATEHHNSKSKFTTYAPLYREQSYAHKTNNKDQRNYPNYKNNYPADDCTPNNANYNQHKHQPPAYITNKPTLKDPNYIPTSFYPTDYHAPHTYQSYHTYGPNDKQKYAPNGNNPSYYPIRHTGSCHNPLCKNKCCNAGVATIKILFQEPCKKKCKCRKYHCKQGKKCHRKKCNGSSNSSSSSSTKSTSNTY